MGALMFRRLASELIMLLFVLAYPVYAHGAVAKPLFTYPATISSAAPVSGATLATSTYDLAPWKPAMFMGALEMTASVVIMERLNSAYVNGGLSLGSNPYVNTVNWTIPAIAGDGIPHTVVMAGTTLSQFYGTALSLTSEISIDPRALGIATLTGRVITQPRSNVGDIADGKLNPTFTSADGAWTVLLSSALGYQTAAAAASPVYLMKPALSTRVQFFYAVSTATSSCAGGWEMRERWGYLSDERGSRWFIAGRVKAATSSAIPAFVQSYGAMYSVVDWTLLEPGASGFLSVGAGGTGFGSWRHQTYGAARYDGDQALLARVAVDAGSIASLEASPGVPGAKGLPYVPSTVPTSTLVPGSSLPTLPALSFDPERPSWWPDWAAALWRPIQEAVDRTQALGLTVRGFLWPLVLLKDIEGAGAI